MRPIMKILKLHNWYAEKALLERYGHEGLIPITILKAIFCTQIHIGASNMVFEDLFGITLLEDNTWLDGINPLKVTIAIWLEVQV
jgi:hypothetical protein